MSKRIGDDELRAAYARRQHGGAARGPDCPSPEALLAALRGEGAQAERMRVLDHALACAACRPELALLHAVSGEGGAAAGAERTRRAPIDLRRFFPLAAAASVALALGVYGVVRWQGGADVLRGGDAEDAVLIAPARDGAVPAGPLEFVWHPTPGALRYTVELSGADGTLLFSAPAADTVLAAELAGIPPGRHQWWVRAHMNDGSERRSAPRTLEVR